MGMVLFLWTQVEMCLCLAWQSSVSFPHWAEPRPPLPCLVSRASLYQRTRLLLRWMDIVASDTHAPYSLMSHSDHGGLSSQDVLWPYIALLCVIFLKKWFESFCEVSHMSLPQPIKNLRRNAGLQCWVTMSASFTVTPNNRTKAKTGPGKIAQWANGLQWERENVSSDPRTHGKSQAW